MALAVWLTINRNCNLSCSWCYQRSYVKSREQMSISLAESLIDLSIGIGAKEIIILGGEPTIHPELIKIIKHSNRLKTTLLTNSIAFADEEFCKRVAETGLTRVSTSLKAATDDGYALYCGGRVLNKVLRGIENLEKSSIKHQISITVCRPIIEQWDAMLKTVQTCGAQDFTFSFERPVVCANNVTFDDRMLPGEIIQFIEKEMYPSLKTLGVGFDINLTLPQCHFSEGFVDKVKSEGHAIAGCSLLMGSGVTFDPKGQVIPCNHLADHPLGAYGKDFRNSEEFKEWRDSPSNKDFYDFASATVAA